MPDWIYWATWGAGVLVAFRFGYPWALRDFAKSVKGGSVERLSGSDYGFVGVVTGFISLFWPALLIFFLLKKAMFPRGVFPEPRKTRKERIAEAMKAERHRLFEEGARIAKEHGLKWPVDN